MSENSGHGSKFTVAADAGGIRITVETSEIPESRSVTIPLAEAFRFLRQFEAALRPLDERHREATGYLDLPDAAATFPDFSDDEVLTSLYAEPVEDEEEFERRTLVMRRVSAAIRACSGISTLDLKRIVSLSRRLPPGEANR